MQVNDIMMELHKCGLTIKDTRQFSCTNLAFKLDMYFNALATWILDCTISPFDLL